MNSTCVNQHLRAAALGQTIVDCEADLFAGQEVWGSQTWLLHQAPLANGYFVPSQFRSLGYSLLDSLKFHLWSKNGGLTFALNQKRTNLLQSSHYTYKTSKSKSNKGIHAVLLDVSLAHKCQAPLNCTLPTRLAIFNTHLDYTERPDLEDQFQK
jgi:hypothetical protein